MLTVGDDVQVVRAGEGDHYTIDGKQVVRVSSVLDQVKGHRLAMWHAKMAAMRAAAPLVHSGLGDPDAALNEFVDAEPMKRLDQAAAVAQACDWKSNMREPMRYRDWRGAVGSLTHAAREHYLLGAREDDWLAWMIEKACTAGYFSEDALKRFELLGYDLERVATDAAHSALPHWRSLMTYLQDFKPDYGNAGIEVVCCNLTHQWAGTIDGDQVLFDRGTWARRQSKYDLVDLPPGDGPMVAIDDLKTSSEVQGSHWLQMSAYVNAEYILVPQGEGLPYKVCGPSASEGAVIVNTRPFVQPFVHFMPRDMLDAIYTNMFVPLSLVRAGLDNLSSFRTRGKARKPKEEKPTCPF